MNVVIEVQITRFGFRFLIQCTAVFTLGSTLLPALLNEVSASHFSYYSFHRTFFADHFFSTIIIILFAKNIFCDNPIFSAAYAAVLQPF